MAISEIIVEGIGPVKVFRRKGLRNIRITVDHRGSVRLNIPWYVPKIAGLSYLHAKRDWIKKHQKTANKTWEDNQALTDNYKLKLHFYEKKKVTSTANKGFFNIYIPNSSTSDKRQELIDKHIKKFLKQEAEKILIPLTFQLAKTAGIELKNVRIKYLKSRWGSCSHKKTITLNSSVVRLPTELAEYVIYHELSHTEHFNHSREFWKLVESFVPDYGSRRKALRKLAKAGFF